MNQSTYKRDFRDPRDMSLWKFNLNGNFKSDLKLNETNKRVSKEITQIPQITCRKENIASAPSNVFIEKLTNEEMKNSKSKQCLGADAPMKEKVCGVVRIVFEVRFLKIYCCGMLFRRAYYFDDF